MTKIICKVCGKEEDVEHWVNKDELLSNQMCETCNFWREKREIDKKRKPHTWAVIDGVHYYLEEHQDGGFVGFSGRKFRIRFDDGFETECDNLWCQGDIDEEWKEVFPDNAKFVANETWKTYGETQYLV